MKKVTKQFLPMLLAFLLVFLSGNTLAEATSSPVTIEVVTWMTEDDYLPDVIEKFHEFQNEVRVNYTSLSTEGDEYNQKLQLMMSSGRGIDVVGLMDVVNFAKYHNAGVLEPLDEYITKYNFDMTPYGSLAEQMKMDGHYYTMSNRTETYVLFYNKTIFDEMGIPYPEQLTWQEFAELAHRMTITKEDGSKQYGCMSFAFFGQSAYMYAEQFGETIVDDALPHLREAYELAYNISNGELKSSLSAAEMMAIGPQNTPWMFANGNVAMYPSGDWTIAMYLNKAKAGEMDVDWDMAYLPYPEGTEQGTSLGGITNYAIPSFSEKKDAAFKFLSYLCGPEGAEIIGSKGTLPAYSTPEAKEAFMQTVDGKNTDPLFNVTKMPPLAVHPKIAEVKQVFTDEGMAYLMGAEDIDTMLNNIESKRLTILQGK